MPSKRAIIFIDGNNFYHCAKKMGLLPGKIDFAKLCEMVCAKFNVVREKTIYYNSIPSIASGKERYYKHLEFLSGLEKLPKFEVKRRKLQRQSTAEILLEKKVLLGNLKLCGKCKPQVEKNCVDCIGEMNEKEKGIDVMLAVDMIEKATKNEYDYCILISGDADFIPALNLVKLHGKQIRIATVQAGFAMNLQLSFPQEFMRLNKDEIEKCYR